ncbi:aminoacetone oxidase family FAD-binding enzyme [Rubrivirga sp. S365]|uniref:Aminoacetone oxidase family FAD-binding enzyme n=1 Tax=Rubrivirga litoralis TaxID=3075598 RepID=A0ABU3BQ13_9BACT|nr:MULTISPECIES: aminoacetone oxidase family FAD-binding enzyme [unclassified Rubrivirga]MDT0631355.1 aminoacetone oxidase family FAD-binding enzyme [Rubrivirga sp. F394]MDT7855946.1 aminoacetone oxidase family FAD-binding enzyme [Rubrivirga sp. S365]
MSSPPASGPPRAVAVIGGGAAGLVAAVFAARAGARVVLLERTRRGGKKIVVSGGGRCNVLPSAVDAGRFVTAGSPRLLRRILDSWPLPEQRAFFEHDLGVPLSLEPETGKLFPTSNRATDVRDALVDAARAAGADLRFDTLVTSLEPGEADRKPAGWRVGLKDAAPLDVDAVVLATGGLSVPKTGSDGFGLRAAEALGLRVEPTYPALTPLTAGDGQAAPHADLSGVSLDVAVRAPGDKKAGRGGVEASGGFLFTHRGYSGPAVLDVSHLATLSRTLDDGGQPVLVRWAHRDAGAWDAAFQAPGPGTVLGDLRDALPARLAEALLSEADVPTDRNRADLRRDERRRLVAVLTEYPLPWTGDEGYKKAEVTGGGVALSEVAAHSLEARSRPGLFLCGEVLDAFGPIGGYNFLWAWATGRLAGRAAGAP